MSIPDYALKMARMLGEVERDRRSLGDIERERRMLDGVADERRRLDAMRDLLQPSAAQLAVEAAIERDAARHSALFGHDLSDRLLNPPLGLGSAAQAALLALEEGALKHSFEIREEWLAGIRGLNEMTRNAASLLGPNISGALGASSDLARLFASTQHTSRVMQEMEDRWKSFHTHDANAAAAWTDVANLSSAGEDLWAGLARDPARLGLISPSLAQAPGIEIYLAARASSLIIHEAPPFDPESEKELETEVTLIVDSFDARLDSFDPQLLVMYRGAVERIERAGTDWARQALISFRELVMHLLHTLAPDAEMDGWAQPHHYDKGKLTRLARLEFIFRGVDQGDFTDFMKKDYAAAIQLFDLLNKVHKKEPKLTEHQFRVLRNRVQGFVNTLLEAAGR